ncbi:MAG: RusA family crossover junction endodeoxyribonuclease [Candidatus Bilamarchaeaceae archaeon]
MRSISFFVPGQPTPAGSKKAIRAHGKTLVIDASGSRGKAWRKKIREVAHFYKPDPLLDGPIVLALHFVRPRPKTHYLRGNQLKPSAPVFPTTRPDLLKLARSVEDALTSVIYKDDAQIVCETLTQCYSAGNNDDIGVYVTITELGGVLCQ